LLRISAGSRALMLDTYKFLPDGRFIGDIENITFLSMFNDLGYAFYSDYLVYGMAISVISSS
jgi:hypothetical protein